MPHRLGLLQYYCVVPHFFVRYVSTVPWNECRDIHNPNLMTDDEVSAKLIEEFQLIVLVFFLTSERTSHDGDV